MSYFEVGIKLHKVVVCSCLWSLFIEVEIECMCDVICSIISKNALF